ncbi:accessory gene regulator b [Lucifera butyrica]|uniref:Accessory gene regulator b n=1 Tax=Lucifera butyrica TaxID=1351585 RepID=A0A498R2U2_9FIRM|nr:accessory gene regulator B family protein [Lucifera butyrica]VBB05137.1 accessory gene regulator b [Lucifera butyrica]
MRIITGVKEIAIGISRYLQKELQLDDKDADAVRFGLESFFDILISLGFLFGVAWGLGLVPYVLAAWLTTSGLRLVSGGAHSSTLFRCIVLGTAILTGIGQLSAMAGKVPPASLFALAGFSVIGGLYAVYRWAPADTPAKSIVSPLKRTRYRRLSYQFITGWTIAVSTWVFFGGEEPLISGLVLASIGGMWWQIFSITPAGYQFVAAMDRLFAKCCL